MALLYHGRPQEFDATLKPLVAAPQSVSGLGYFLFGNPALASAAGGEHLAAYDIDLSEERCLVLDGPEARGWPFERLLLEYLDVVRAVVGWRTAVTLEQGAWLLAEDRNATVALAEDWMAGIIAEEDALADTATAAAAFVAASSEALRYKPFLAALKARLEAEYDAVVWPGRDGPTCCLMLPKTPLAPVEIHAPEAPEADAPAPSLGLR